MAKRRLWFWRCGPRPLLNKVTTAARQCSRYSGAHTSTEYRIQCHIKHICASHQIESNAAPSKPNSASRASLTGWLHGLNFGGEEKRFGWSVINDKEEWTVELDSHWRGRQGARHDHGGRCCGYCALFIHLNHRFMQHIANVGLAGRHPLELRRRPKRCKC